MPGKLFSRKVDKVPGESEECAEGESPGSREEGGYGEEPEKLVGGKESAKLAKARMKELKKGRKKEAKGEKKSNSDPEAACEDGHTVLTVQKYHRGFLSALLWWVVLLPVLLIPTVGVLFAFIIVPFFAGRRGSRWVEKKYAVELGILTAVVVSLLEIIFLDLLLESSTSGTVMDVTYGSTEYLIIFFGFICNLGFCLLGAVSGKFKYFRNPETDQA